MNNLKKLLDKIKKEKNKVFKVLNFTIGIILSAIITKEIDENYNYNYNILLELKKIIF